jgi:hypothetical protein
MQDSIFGPELCRYGPRLTMSSPRPALDLESQCPPALDDCWSECDDTDRRRAPHPATWTTNQDEAGCRPRALLNCWHCFPSLAITESVPPFVHV